jgi:hypothetical protein
MRGLAVWIPDQEIFSSDLFAAISSDKWCRWLTRRSMKWSNGVSSLGGFI